MGNPEIDEYWDQREVHTQQSDHQKEGQTEGEKKIKIKTKLPEKRN